MLNADQDESNESLDKDEPTSFVQYAEPDQFSKRNTLVIGAGPAGIRFVTALLKKNPLARITLLGNEPYDPYNRVQLTGVLAREVSRDSIDLTMPDPSDFPNFRYCVANASAIDREKKVVRDANDKEYPYSELVLAVGARAFTPAIPGADLTGVYTFRNLKDTDSLYARLARARRIVIVGGGLLGLEAAKALKQQHTEVMVLQQGDLLMNRQLDETSSGLLKQHIEELDIKVRLGSSVRTVTGESRVNGVKTREGEIIDCDTVLFCTGITPNIELAQKAGLAFGKGIKVDDTLRTSDPSIYALGECSEHNNITFGLVSPGYEQAAVLADRLAGGTAMYKGSLDVARLKVVGQPLMSVGASSAEGQGLKVSELVYRDKKSDVYRKLVLRRGRLIGAISYGEWEEAPRVQEGLKQNRYIPVWLRWSFRLTGNLWPSGANNDITQWPQSAIVCQCNNISVAELLVAKDQGCTDLTALSAETGAGTVCGSCKPLLVQLTGGLGSPEPAGFWPFLAFFSALAAILAGLIGFMPGLDVASSVQDAGVLESIWNDKFYKQVSGFSLLGLTAIGLLMSLRKRLPRFSLGSFNLWRLLHTLLGATAITVLILHSGLHIGENLNRMLMVNFLLVVLLGAVMGSVISFSHQLGFSLSKRLRDVSGWLHIIVSWPLPVLIILHIVSVYYF